MYKLFCLSYQQFSPVCNALRNTIFLITKRNLIIILRAYFDDKYVYINNKSEHIIESKLTKAILRIKYIYINDKHNYWEEKLKSLPSLYQVTQLNSFFIKKKKTLRSRTIAVGTPVTAGKQNFGKVGDPGGAATTNPESEIRTQGFRIQYLQRRAEGEIMQITLLTD